ncbi:2TM domain-containing protein [Candidatus Leptofilum sp.]|uniref:2TM domain-containing protein n=1 Tax=Candidatus Leptofilum sp. TaxID=3241576 RepID=UPI003B5B4831
MNNQEAYQRAKKRVEAKVRFYRHLTIYIAVSVLLMLINFSTSTEYLWFIWPLMGWGFAVLLHALQVFGYGGGSTVTEQMIEKEMEKEAQGDI